MATYVPFYAEEIFIANCYGTDEEIAQLDLLLEDPEDKQNTVEMMVLIIKRLMSQAGIGPSTSVWLS